MTRSYAINYFERNSYLSREEIEWEVDQIITLPGRACTHTMGDLTLRRLKQEAKRQIGNALDICLKTIWGEGEGEVGGGGVVRDLFI